MVKIHDIMSEYPSWMVAIYDDNTCALIHHLELTRTRSEWRIFKEVGDGVWKKLPTDIAVYYAMSLAVYQEGEKRIKEKEENTMNHAIDASYFVASDKAVLPQIDKVYFNAPYTIVIWSDKTKTAVKASDDDAYDRYFGLMMCMLKKKLGDKYYSKWKQRVNRIVEIDSTY